MIMEFNKKKCVVAFVILFFYLLLLSLFLLRMDISTVAFCFDVPSLRMLALFLYCNLIYWLFTPFQVSIGKKKRKRSIVPTCDI